LNGVRAYRITAQCDTCEAREFGMVSSRRQTQAEVLLRVFCAGWEAQHQGHDQLVIASPEIING
jgi:hypothetical protein